MTFLNLDLGTPIIRAADTVTGDLGALGARFIVDGNPTDGRFALVEHPIIPRGLAAPLHLHTREDEFSFVLEGRWGFQLGSTVVHGEPGDLIYKPRDVWHTFWNATDEPARLLEIISPAGFEQLFVEAAGLAGTAPEDTDAAMALLARYGLQLDVEATAPVIAEHRLVDHPCPRRSMRFAPASDRRTSRDRRILRVRPPPLPVARIARRARASSSPVRDVSDGAQICDQAPTPRAHVDDSSCGERRHAACR